MNIVPNTLGNSIDTQSEIGNTPLSERLRLVLAGRRNAGKSSLINSLLERQVSIISPVAGTTTDPVTRAWELPGLGPIAVTDTAGLDDEGSLGAQRIQKSLQRLGSADIILFVTPLNQAPTDGERQLLKELEEKKAPVVIAGTFADMDNADSLSEDMQSSEHTGGEKKEWLKNRSWHRISNTTGEGIENLRKAIRDLKPIVEVEITPLEGLVNESDLVLLVTPIDLAAPKGRLILPQVETIRDALDKDCAALVVKERELYDFYTKLPVKPKLVITDSQAFHQVAGDLPDDQPLTSFSILFARKKGDLKQLIKGVRALEQVPEGGKILVMESCSHHRQADDIGTVKIPRLFRQLVHPKVEFSHARSLPESTALKQYDLIIHCGGCMVTRSFMLNRLRAIGRQGIPVVNYGLFLGWANGLLPRALQPIPEAAGLWESAE